MDNSLSEIARKTQYEATVKTLGKRPRAENVFMLADNTLALTSGLLEVVEQRSSPVACDVGCHFCCYLMATVSAPEALAIVHRLRESSTQEDLRELKQKIKRTYQRTKKLDSWARARVGIPCPFLSEQGLCGIYAYRPLDCMTYHSLSRQACEEVMERPEQGHPTNPDLQTIGTGIKIGLGQGIAGANLERPALRYELIEAIHICLNDDQAMEKYLAGENIFKPAAIITDSEGGIGHKIRYAPPHLKAEAKRVFTLERRRARQEKKKGQKRQG